MDVLSEQSDIVAPSSRASGLDNSVVSVLFRGGNAAKISASDQRAVVKTLQRMTDCGRVDAFQQYSVNP